MKKTTLTLLILLLMPLTLYADTIIDLKKISGQSESIVEQYIGKPTSCKKSKYGNKCQYKKAQIEIVYINNKADWITVEDMGHTKFNAAAITALGLGRSRPSFKNKYTMKWENLNGFISISMFPTGTAVDYAYIKVNTQ